MNFQNLSPLSDVPVTDEEYAEIMKPSNGDECIDNVDIDITMIPESFFDLPDLPEDND